MLNVIYDNLAFSQEIVSNNKNNTKQLYFADELKDSVTNPNIHSNLDRLESFLA